MDQQEIKILKLFDALIENNSQSQRDLSKKLNYSLGIVNSILKQTIKKGYIKVVSGDRGRLKYNLTLSGKARRSILSYEYVLYSIRYYNETRNKIKTLFCKFEEDKIKAIILIGTGELAEIAYITAKEKCLVINGIIDDKNLNFRFIDLPILDLSILNQNQYDAVVITDIENAPTIKNHLIQKGVAKEMIFEVI